MDDGARLVHLLELHVDLREVDEDDEDGDYQDIQAAGVSLREHLDQQIALSPLSDRDRALVRFLARLPVW